MNERFKRILHGHSQSTEKANSEKKESQTLVKYFKSIQSGSQVIIKMDSSVQKSMPHKRFHGKIGVIKRKQGRGYVITVPQGNSIKEIITRAEHLEPYTGK